MSALVGKSVLITGASRGIGAATARAFAAAGARVAMVSRSRNEIADLAGELGADRALAIPCDVSRYWEMEAAVDATVREFGGLDVLVANAGVIEPIAPVAASDPEDWAKLIEINLTGVYHGLRAALPVMLEAGGGTILAVSSGAAAVPLEGWSAYCASKAGAAMLLRCLDLETRQDGIRAIGLSPGTVATDMQAVIRDSGVNPVSQLDWSDHIPPDWPARALVWLATPAADDLVGTEVSLRDPAILRRIGLAA
ncbi:MAG: SDR family oxidoreductase [Mangrovicoccus sp.]|nr:SDR family oxidoreductase [Mangrovicoccus sp.]